MAYFNKIGLLILNGDKTKMMVCEPGRKYHNKKVTQYLMPGGQLEKDETDEQNLVREIKEELDCEIYIQSLKLINEYTDVSAAGPDKDVMIRMYQGELIGKPKASSEIGALHWIGKEHINNPKVSQIIKNKIIPDLIQKGILK